jgi:hypothetical protein
MVDDVMHVPAEDLLSGAIAEGSQCGLVDEGTYAVVVDAVNT